MGELGVGFPKILAALGVANDGKFAARRDEHVGRNFARERAFFFLMDVLRGEMDTFFAFQQSRDGGQIHERRCENDARSRVKVFGQNSLDKLVPFGNGFVHFPVACDYLLARHFFEIFDLVKNDAGEGRICLNCELCDFDDFLDFSWHHVDQKSKKKAKADASTFAYLLADFAPGQSRSTTGAAMSISIALATFTVFF